MQRSGSYSRYLLASVGFALTVACASPIVKPEAFDTSVIEKNPLPASMLGQRSDEETVVAPSLAWMSLTPGDRLAFAGYRDTDERGRFCVVLECDPERDRLALLPLATDETPIDVIGNPERRKELMAQQREYAALPAESRRAPLMVSLKETVERRRLGPPIPVPGRILGVAANFPSHLEVDLDIDQGQMEAIAKTPPRVFQKHPPVAAPKSNIKQDWTYEGVIGPFDSVRFPQKIALPFDENGKNNLVDTALDYEVEIGIVIGKTLTWEKVQAATDDELYSAIAGYLLVSDVKARNPQVFERAMSRDEVPTGDSPYLTGIADVDLLFGNWDANTCGWWSYAASYGDFSALGPYFVESDGATRLTPRSLLCARSYGEADVRGAEIPGDRRPGVFYLRQCAYVTEAREHGDSMLWTVPAILRGILAPHGALELTPERQLNPGDVVALGTPGGIVLTVRNRTMYRLLGYVLFWWDALDWHDAFFGKDSGLYLRDGDALLLWGEGLGCQRLPIRRDSRQ